MDLSASVTSPSNVSEDADISETEDGGYGVSFVPKELGVHTVSVKYKEVHIPGSPFQFTVGPLRDGGAHRVHAGGYSIFLISWPILIDQIIFQKLMPSLSMKYISVSIILWTFNYITLKCSTKPDNWEDWDQHICGISTNWTKLLWYVTDRVWSAVSRDNRASSTYGPARPAPDPCPSRSKDPARPTSTSKIGRMDLATSFTTSANPVKFSEFNMYPF